jgi:hypothetical protein
LSASTNEADRATSIGLARHDTTRVCDFFSFKVPHKSLFLICEALNDTLRLLLQGGHIRILVFLPFFAQRDVVVNSPLLGSAPAPPPLFAKRARFQS